MLKYHYKYFWLVVMLLMGVVPVYAHNPDALIYNWNPILQFSILMAGVMSTSVVVGYILGDRPTRDILVSLTIAECLVLTGFIHLAVGIPADWLLIANGVGYFVLLGLRFVEPIRNSRWMIVLNVGIIIYTSITIVGYFYTHGHVDSIGLVSKAVEGVLILAVLTEIGLRTVLMKRREIAST